MRQSSNRPQRTSKCGKSISETWLSPRVPPFCSYLNRRMATWNLFVEELLTPKRNRKISPRVSLSTEIRLFWRFSSLLFQTVELKMVPWFRLLLRANSLIFSNLCCHRDLPKFPNNNPISCSSRRCQQRGLSRMRKSLLCRMQGLPRMSWCHHVFIHVWLSHTPPNWFPVWPIIMRGNMDR